MNLSLIKKKSTTDEYRVPSLIEVGSEYAALMARQQSLSALLSTLRREADELSTKIAAQPKAPHSAGVSRLLGDPEDAAPHLRKRRREVSGEITDAETALGVVARRLAAARDVASKAACDAIRSEYQRRLSFVCEAAKALEAAREGHDALLDDLEREDINMAYLRPVRPFFLGDRGQGRVFHFLKEVKEGGFNV
jgi:chromosome segregation ATPase